VNYDVEGADLVYELTGNPEVLNEALDVCGYDTRIVVGSWYGSKQAPIDLGGRFHRRHISIISSQVSTIAPSLRGRWSKDRRFHSVLQQLQTLPVDSLITHEFSLTEASRAYANLLSEEKNITQCIFQY
jgi:threonine dehydrogenase-like Zn-dependent dehydrogenase